MVVLVISCWNLLMYLKFNKLLSAKCFGIFFFVLLIIIYIYQFQCLVSDFESCFLSVKAWILSNKKTFC